MRRLERIPCRPVFVLFAALLAAGCLPAAIRGDGRAGPATWRVSTPPADEPVFFPGSPVCAMLLPADAYADDEADDEIPRLLRPREVLRPDAGAAVPAGPRSSFKLGVRGGLVWSGKAERGDWDDVPNCGVYFRRVPARPARATVELAADYAQMETSDRLLSSTIYAAHANLLFGRFGAGGFGPYFFLGGQAIMESATRTATGEEVSGVGGAAEAGFGLGSRNGRFDVKATYSLLLGDEANTKDNLVVSVGIAF